jgi:toxin-antitoxin system PIN domain toxin
VYLCDSGIWLALIIEQHVHSVAVRGWLDGIDDAHRALFCRATQQAVLRLLTTTAVFAPYGLQPMSNSTAWQAFDETLTDERIAFRADEPAGISRRWRQFSTRRASSPKLWMDAYLAAFAAASGSTLVTTDRAFRQFDGLDLELLL